MHVTAACNHELLSTSNWTQFKMAIIQGYQDNVQHCLCSACWWPPANKAVNCLAPLLPLLLLLLLLPGMGPA
jgi:hypothetical protein